MDFDILLPNNNEESFIMLAEKLNYKGLLFLYSIDNFTKKKEAKYTTSLTIIQGIIAEKKDIPKAKKISNFVLTIADEKDSRNVIEQHIPDAMVNFEDNSINDTLKQRYSGLNNVLCDLMAKNDINLCFSLAEIKQNNEDYLGRIMQNITLAQKHKVPIIIASFTSDPYQMRNPKDIISFFVTIGMKETIAKHGLINCYKKYISNKKEKAGESFGKGIEVV